MKIGFFGNTNNYPLMLARAMRELGHSVLLVVESTELLHRPENRFPEFGTDYPAWILDGSRFSEWDYITLNPQIAPVLEALSACDALVLNSLGPSLLPLVNRPAIAMLTGSDLCYYADLQLAEVRSATWGDDYKSSAEGQTNLNHLRDFVKRQRDGIAGCVAVSHIPRGIAPVNDSLLDSIDVSATKRFFILMAEVERVRPMLAPHNQPLRVFCATRFTWKLPIEPGRSSLDYKGSDVMVRGLGLFHHTSGVRLDIRLIRKGLHVAELEQLIAEEGLTDQVTWSDEMPLVKVWEEFARCDIVFEQLGESMIGMAGLDAMAAGRPVIGNARPEILGTKMPICQARTPEEVCAQLKRLVADPVERERIGLSGRRFVEENASPAHFARVCLQYFEQVGSDRKPACGAGHTYYLRRIADETAARQTVLAARQSEVALQQSLASAQADLQACQAAFAASVAELAAREQQLLQLLRAYAVTGKRALGRRVLAALFTREGEHGWVVGLPDLAPGADNEEFPERSVLMLFENENPLGPAHSLHDDIRNLGGGRLSHWKTNLYFSTSDGSDPNTNGRMYAIVFVSPHQDALNPPAPILS
jgi:glycosyltransferase involved in cell wall biosynthesis